MVECFNELVTQTNSDPTCRNRVFPAYYRCGGKSQHGLDGATHRLLPAARVEQACVVIRGGQPMRLHDTAVRSEERRGGGERRARGAADHLKKKKKNIERTVELSNRQ